MAPLSYLIALPTLSFLLLVLFGASMSRSVLSFCGVIGIALSAVYSVMLLTLGNVSVASSQVLWNFLPPSLGFAGVDLALYGDSLALVMCAVVSFVSCLIAIYSVSYMADEQGFRRFFAVVNLFVAFMLLLVLADNLWFLFMGWEGVGICSYLLIGFYYTDKNAESAAMKAFLTTRIGDVFLLLAMFLCALAFHTLCIKDILMQAGQTSELMVTLIACGLLLAAVGKSAQLPLQTWLADAMFGPTPVSALIHAATMVTAGVYLVARTSSLFALSPVAQLAVLVIGAATLIFAGIAAFFQTDLKRVLAYSTMSQIGFMFLALGVKAAQAAIFHLVTHAFFKALLFLCAGVIGHSLHTYELKKMGGLKNHNPVLFALFLIGCLNLIGLPFVTAGFFSKEWILTDALSASNVGMMAYGIACLGTVLTGLYSTRMVALVFLGTATHKSKLHMPFGMCMPLCILAACSVVMGWLGAPSFIMAKNFFSDYLSLSLATASASEHSIIFAAIPTLMAFLGIALALMVMGNVDRYRQTIRLHGGLRILVNGGGFDWLYQRLFVMPYLHLSRMVKNDRSEQALALMLRFIKHGAQRINQLHKASLSHYLSFFILAALTFASIMVF